MLIYEWGSLCFKFKVQQPNYWILHKISWDIIDNLLIMLCHEVSQPEDKPQNQLQLSTGPTWDTQRQEEEKTVNLGARMDVSVLCVSKMIQVIRWVDTKGLARGLLPNLRTQSFPPFLFFFVFLKEKKAQIRWVENVNALYMEGLQIVTNGLIN